MPIKKVIRVELVEKVREFVKKTKRHDYVRGGYKIEEVIHRITTVIPTAILECGHSRTEYNHGTEVSKASRLECYECDKIQRQQD